MLGEDDFVAAEINWDSKVTNMRRIQQGLNLKLKDFVFIDDRADQRELVREAMPEVVVLDATSSRVPEQLAIWAAALSDHPEMDRTQQYRQREQRESLLAEGAAVAEDPGLAFSKLEIRVEIREARAAELKRVAELINRTNQFNLAGSRTSLKELRDWQDSPGRRVVVVDARDKFGPMGLIAALQVDLTGPAATIPAFVLSCRVFGYGIEDALLNAVKRLARAGAGGVPMTIAGAYKETPHNEPCRTVYPSNGFTYDGRVVGPGRGRFAARPILADRPGPPDRRRALGEMRRPDGPERVGAAGPRGKSGRAAAWLRPSGHHRDGERTGRRGRIRPRQRANPAGDGRPPSGCPWMPVRQTRFELANYR